MDELSDMELILTALCFTKVGYSRRSLMTLAVNDYVTSYIFGQFVCLHTFLSFKSFLSGDEMNI